MCVCTQDVQTRKDARGPMCANKVVVAYLPRLGRRWVPAFRIARRSPCRTCPDLDSRTWSSRSDCLDLDSRICSMGPKLLRLRFQDLLVAAFLPRIADDRCRIAPDRGLAAALRSGDGRTAVGNSQCGCACMSVYVFGHMFCERLHLCSR